MTSIELRAGNVAGLEGVEIRHAAALGDGYLFTYMFESLGAASFIYPWDALHPRYGPLPAGFFGYELAPQGNSEHPLTVQVRLRPETEDRLSLEASLINPSERVYSLCWADMCLMFRFVPGFPDLAGERCLLHTAGGMAPAATSAHVAWGGAWSPLVQAYRIDGADLSYPFGVVPGLAMWSVSQQPLASGCIMMARQDGAWHVALGWDVVANVAYNPDDEHHCIHSDPWFGAVPARASVTRRGVILFGRRGAAALLGEYLDWRSKEEGSRA
jgi:hypothetical protein